MDPRHAVRRQWLIALTSCALIALTLALRSPQSVTEAPSPEAQAAAPEVPAPPSAAPLARVDTSALEARVAELSRRLGELETARPTKAPPPDAEAGAAQARELTEKVVADLTQRVSEHQASPLNGAWAAQTTQRIEAGLESLLRQPGNSAHVERIDCRSESCITTLRFDSREQALAHYSDFVTNAWDVPCATTALIPPADVAGPVKVEVLFLSCNG